jgi:peptide/nickel transport system permease protein
MSSLTLEYATTRALPRTAPAFLTRLLRRRGSTLVLLLLAAVVLVALFGGFLAPYDPIDVQVVNKLRPPGPTHPMGTDPLGRDIFSRLLAGAGQSVQSVLVIMTSAVALGMLLGSLAGFFGGVVDEVIMRVTDVFLAFPAFVLALAIAGALGPSLINAMLAVSIVWWPWYARLVRGQVLALKQEQYVEAARCMGCSNARIMARHILPNFLVPVIVQATLDMGAALVTTASLSYIGMGAQPPSPEWGAMLNQARQYFLNAWWLTFFPGLAIFVTVLIFNFFGDLVRAALPN